MANISDVVTVPLLARFLEGVRGLIAAGMTAAQFAQKSIEAQPDLIYAASSTDGVAYTVNVPGVTALYPGLKITVLLNKTSTSTSPTLNLNGLGAKAIRQPLTTNSFSSTTPSSASWLNKEAPITLTYNGSLWRTDFFRPSATTLYGKVAIANGGTGADNAAAALANLGGASKDYVDQQIAALRAELTQ